jgi:CheY-like chemotaxis protein
VRRRALSNQRISSFQWAGNGGTDYALWARSMNQSAPPIVVVDDDEDTLVFLSDFFDMFDMLTIPCRNGNDALDCIREHQPAVVILDVLLDGTSGVEVFNQIRSLPQTQSVPVIFFTGSGDQLRRLLPNYDALNAYLIVKPKIEQLSALVQRLLDQSSP